MPGTLRLILGDQLNRQISALTDCHKTEDTILMCEVWDETQYVKHHKKKIAFLFSAMRHFAQELTEAGYTVRYIRLDDPANTHNFTAEVKRAIKALNPQQLVCTMPGEYRVWRMMQSWQDELDIPTDIRPHNLFMATPEDFADWAENRKQLRMEYFYREMRKRHGILMTDGAPEGGAWNYDAANRVQPTADLTPPAPYTAPVDEITQEVMDLVAARFADHFGDLNPFYFAVTRQQALAALDMFIEERLPLFGDYQDAMLQNEPWMYHSHISFYLNCSLLTPQECIQAAEQAYWAGQAPLNAVEGFIRQILGWREFVRGLYWLKMPTYKTLNELNAQRPLPAFYWTAETHMNCLKQCITETQHHAYAHHIQRLMVLGNFALLTGLHPDEVNEWYLIVYADAYEWVELPNVSGMILFADGGLLASKPYAAGGSYINKMSNYCAGCKYNVKEKTGATACPFNYLYWHFLIENQEKLRGNPRLGMVYKTLDKMALEKQNQISQDAQHFLVRMTQNEKV